MKHFPLLFLVIALASVLSCQAPTFQRESRSNAAGVPSRTLSSYSEPWRPQFHFTPAAHWMNDPNGLVYYAGEYHLFYQYYPYASKWGPMHWGHAVSTDLIRWTQLPTALFPDANGSIFSGSAVIDENNTAGFQTGPEKAMVAIFTHDSPSGQVQSIAYSNDKGRSWTKFPGNPVIPNPGIADFRDPKVFWHEATGKWVLSLAAHDRVLFYGSPNLKTWSLLSEFGVGHGSHVGIWECPDLFPLNVDGGGTQKWVLLVSVNNGAPAGGSGTQYFLGDFDGTQFTNSNPGQTLWLDYGKDNYAGVTWSGTPGADRTYIGWMSNWNYAEVTPTQLWRSAMTLPRTLKLKTVGGVPSLIQDIAPTWTAYRGTPTNLTNRTVVPGTNLLSAVSGSQYEILAEFQDNTSTAAEYGFRLRTGQGRFVTAAYHRAEPVVFVDRRFSANTGFHPDFSNVVGQSMVPQNGKVKLRILVDASSVEVIGNDGLASITEQIFPEAGDTGIELYSIGGSVTLNSLTYWPIGSNARPVQAPDQFDSNLGPLTTVSGQWETTPDGLRGQSVGDGFALAQSLGVQSDVTVSATLRVGTSGAAAVVARANASATAGYVANIDDGGLVKLWKVGGVVLGQVSVPVVRGQTYRLTLVAQGSRLRVYFDGQTTPLIDVLDSTWASGYVGLNVWNGISGFTKARWFGSVGFRSNLGELTGISGSWQSGPIGWEGNAVGDGFVLALNKGTGSNFTYRGTLNLATGWAGALVFRANATATNGYVANVDAGGFLKLWKIGGPVLATAPRPIVRQKEYELRVVTQGSLIQVYLDQEGFPAISVVDSELTSGYWGLNAWSGTSVFQDVLVEP